MSMCRVWQDENGWHFEEEAKCIDIATCENGDWIWQDEDGNFHLIRDGKELTKGMKCAAVELHKSVDWSWQGDDGDWHKVKNE